MAEFMLTFLGQRWIFKNGIDCVSLKQTSHTVRNVYLVLITHRNVYRSRKSINPVVHEAALERLLSEEECIESAPFERKFESEIYLIE